MKATSQQGKFWKTVVFQIAQNDLTRHKVDPAVLDRFHALGDIENLATAEHVCAIARPDCPGMYRIQFRDQWARGIFAVVRKDQHGYLMLLGVFPRDKYTYTRRLTARLSHLGLLKKSSV